MNDQSKVPALMAGAEVRPIIPASLEEAFRLSTAIARSGMAPKGIQTPEQIMVIILQGLEVGLSPFVALQSIALINGRPALYGDGLLAVVRRSGALERITEAMHEAGTDGAFARCTVTREGQRVTREFSKKDAVVAGLWGKRGKDGAPTPWVTYPNRMLQMRARAFALRDVFPDVLKGLASREEMEDVAGNGGGAVINSPPPPPPPAEPEPTPLEEAVTKAKKVRKPSGKTGKADPETIQDILDRDTRGTDAPIEPPVPPPPPPDPEEEMPGGAGGDPGDYAVLWEEDGERVVAPEDIT